MGAGATSIRPDPSGNPPCPRKGPGARASARCRRPRLCLSPPFALWPIISPPCLPNFKTRSPRSLIDNPKRKPLACAHRSHLHVSCDARQGVKEYPHGSQQCLGRHSASAGTPKPDLVGPPIHIHRILGVHRSGVRVTRRCGWRWHRLLRLYSVRIALALPAGRNYDLEEYWKRSSGLPHQQTSDQDLFASVVLPLISNQYLSAVCGWLLLLHRLHACDTHSRSTHRPGLMT